ncbi:PGDYG domain-containing protein [Thauera sp.]|uniref:PGDYG domain-containing protein n=1 Tax=Thauera sp. TaxID=1905334 RepID=UPI0039E655CE
MNDTPRAAPRTFDTYEDVPGMRPCIKKPVIVHARRIDQPFRVRSLEGDFKLGKPGDVLMRGIDGELYICDADIFARTYDWTA